MSTLIWNLKHQTQNHKNFEHWYTCHLLMLEKFVFINSVSLFHILFSAESPVISYLRAFIVLISSRALLFVFSYDTWRRKKSEGSDSVSCQPSHLWSSLHTQHGQSQSINSFLSDTRWRYTEEFFQCWPVLGVYKTGGRKSKRQRGRKT